MITANTALVGKRREREAIASLLADYPDACVGCGGNGGRLLKPGTGYVDMPVVIIARGRAVLVCLDCIGAHATPGIPNPPRVRAGEGTALWPRCPLCGALASPYDLGKPTLDCDHKLLSGLVAVEHHFTCDGDCDDTEHQ